MQVLRTDAVSICEEMGFSAAGKWNKDRMQQKLVSVAQTAADSDYKVADERLNGILQEIIKLEGKVDVVKELDDDNVPPQVAKGDEDVKEETQVVSEEKEKEPEMTEKQKADEAEAAKIGKEIEQMTPGVKKEKKEKKEKTPKTPKTPKEKKHGDGFPGGIHSIKNRLYLAATVVKKHGLAAGTPESLLKELDELFMEVYPEEKSNLAACKNQLTLAWHCVNGYLNG